MNKDIEFHKMLEKLWEDFKEIVPESAGNDNLFNTFIAGIFAYVTHEKEFEDLSPAKKQAVILYFSDKNGGVSIEDIKKQIAEMN